MKFKLQHFGHLMRRTDTGKDPDAGKYWRQEEKGMTEDEMVGWHHWLNAHEFEHALEVGNGQETWHAAVHGVAESQTWLSDWKDWTELKRDIYCKMGKMSGKISNAERNIKWDVKQRNKN